MSWAAEAAAVLVKELRTEWRTRVSLSATGLFALGALTLIALALRSQKATAELAAGLLWLLVLFTAATGLGRSFVAEAERGTALALRLHARATAVWAGKYAANVVLLSALMALATPLLMLALEISWAKGNAGALAAVLTLGIVGVAAVFTTTSALVAQATGGTGLLAALSFPVLALALVSGVHGTQAALGVGAAAQVGAWRAAAGDLQVLGAYAAIAITASLLLFDYVWND